jgi:pimeloyl-ACP methyl ester carboxylesterase
MKLPVGYKIFHKNKFINYQLNRWYSLGFAEQNELELIGKKIKSFESYVTEFIEAGEKALSENRRENAAAYFRAAEFLIEPTNPLKEKIYEKYIQTFDSVFENKTYTRHAVPYENGKLSALHFKALGELKNETIVAIGGFDSFIEEFYCMWNFFAEQGYDVIAFEGPGQGTTLRKYKLTFDHDYEKPTQAILHYFQIKSATMLGVSMGGYWAMRAAAYTPTIKRVIAMPPVYDWMELTNSFNRKLVGWLIRQRRLMNFMIRLKMMIGTLKHTINHALYISGKTEPVDAVIWMLIMNKQHLSSEKINQNVLLLVGENDAFQPPKLMHKQAKALAHAKSVDTIMLKKEDHADQHCHMGNIQLALDTMLTWMNDQRKK